MKTSLAALLLGAALLLSACSTTSTVRQHYAASPQDTYWYALHGNEDTDAEALGMLRRQLDEKLGQARLSGTKGSPDTRQIDITITHYYMRSNGARFWAGIMAGRDKVKSTVEVKDAQGATVAAFDVESTNTSAWGTSEGLIGKHAQEIAERLQAMRGTPAGG